MQFYMQNILTVKMSSVKPWSDSNERGIVMHHRNAIGFFFMNQMNFLTGRNTTINNCSGMHNLVQVKYYRTLK